MLEESFVAYASQDVDASEIILEGVQKANSANGNRRHYEPWEFNEISGRPLTDPIFEKIETATFLTADITFLNLNVVYEIGYAIGKGKKVVLIRNGSIEGDSKFANSVGIFDTVGYKNYLTSDELRNFLTSAIDLRPFPLDIASDRKNPIFTVSSPTTDSFSAKITSRIKKAGYRYRSYDPNENSRLSANEAIQGVSQASGIVLRLLDSSDDQARAHNVRSMFVAGLSHGMKKPTCLFCPHGYSAPLDVRDEAKHFSEPGAIERVLRDFWPQVAEYMQSFEVREQPHKNLLGQLWIGDPAAENEMPTLGEYYLSKDEFDRSLRGDVNLAVGRKGSGKTALFVRLRDKVRDDRSNIVVDLKPETYQLVRLKEEILSVLIEGSQQHLVIAFWEYLILVEIAYKLLEKDKRAHTRNHLLKEPYENLQKLYDIHTSSISGDFSERLLKLSENLIQNFQKLKVDRGARLNNDMITQILYSSEIPELREALNIYLGMKGRTLVLFDNLDRGWATSGVDKTDVLILRCLIDAARKVEREMRKNKHQFNCIAFIRNDVYQYLVEATPDYGKETKVVLDWSDPALLREMLSKRLRHGLIESNQIDAETTFDDMWKQISVPHVHGEDSCEFIISRSMMRPRNVIKFGAGIGD